MRPIWSGSIVFGLVSVPVHLHSALTYNDISFNLLHRECQGRIKQQTYCPTCGRVVARDELVKGYEFSKDEYVLMEDPDFDKLQAAATRNIEVGSFVDLSQVDPIYFNRPYFLTPDDDSKKPFALFTQALKDTRKAALVKFVMREKEYVGCIAPKERALVLYVMHHKDDVKDIGDFQVGTAGAKAKEVEMAHQLIEHLSEPFDPAYLQDTYQEKLQKILKDKARGRPIKAASAKRPAKVVNLMEALKQSLRQSARAGKQPAAGTAAAGERKRRKA